MRPARPLLFLLVILISLTGLYFLFPAGDYFPSPDHFFRFLKEERAGIHSNELIIRQDSLIAPADDYPVATSDSLFSNPDNEYLKPFFDSLNKKKSARILYYGDSQLEGDRITFELRRLLRKDYGGTGPGLLLPVMPVMYTRSVWVRSSPLWKRYTYLSYRNGDISDNCFGPLMAKCRFAGEGQLSDQQVEAWVRIKPSGGADRAVSEYETLRLFYSDSPPGTFLKISSEGGMHWNDSLRSGRKLRELKVTSGFEGEILLEFKGYGSPDIFGISIESDTGIIVDNIPLRGSAGLEFTMAGRENLEESLKLLSPDLIVLQFGLNIVRNVRSDYSYYEDGIVRQISLLRDLSPGTSFLIAGVTEMAYSTTDSSGIYPNIDNIIEAQQNAARRSYSAFWDARKAMGGKGSVLRWASAPTPLVQKDLVHLTYAGADSVSQLLADYLLTETPVIHTTEYPAAGTITEPADKKLQGSYAESPRWLSSASKGLEYLLSYDQFKPMIFTTPAFWVFLLVVLVGYSLIYKRLFVRNLYLFLVSLFFYYKSGGLFLFLLVFVSLIDFACGILIAGRRSKASRRLFLLISIISNLGILAYFKYSAFLAETLNDLLGTEIKVYDFLASYSNSLLGTSFDTSAILLPVGISFFTFQSLSYTIDVYRRKVEPVRNPADFGFYVSFFPQLVAGPIVRASEFIPQLYKPWQVSKREFSHAIFLILKGLIKKIIISDFLATSFVDGVFATPAQYSGFENLMAIYGYGLQIYCDFSGYTDIAIGTGLILGFRLPVNFNSPYKASDISDFWRRWHISLSRWLKDYLYIPLGGSKKGNIRTSFNLMITMLLGGLWHGAAMRFILWGGLHGIGLVINKIWSYITRGRLAGSGPGRFISVLITFNFVSFCWIFFRAGDLNAVMIMLNQILDSFSPGSWLSVVSAYAAVLAVIITGYLIHFLPESIKESYRGLYIRSPLVLQALFVLLFAVILYNMKSTEVVPFIYFRF